MFKKTWLKVKRLEQSFTEQMGDGKKGDSIPQGK